MADWRPPRPPQPPQIIVDSGNEGRMPGRIQEEDTPSTAGQQSSSTHLLPQFPSAPFAQAPRFPSIYTTPEGSNSSERLVAPTTGQGSRIYRGYAPEYPSPLSSRRTSWESIGSREDFQGPFVSPLDDPAKASSSGEAINTQTVAQKYLITPTPDLILFPEDVEADDYLHNPDPNESDKYKFEIWSRRGMINVGGLIFVILGILALFVAYPVLYDNCVFCVPYPKLTRCSTFSRKLLNPDGGACAADPNCLSDKVALLKNQRTGLIDPDTPDSEKTRTSNDGTKLQLVVRLSLGLVLVYINHFSSLMSSTMTDERSLMAMTPSSKAWISGTVSLRTSNGTTRTL